MPSSQSPGPVAGDAERTEQRHRRMIELVGSTGFLTIEALAQHFDVTVQTIRRDVNTLASEGRLSRYRGGAGLPSSIENMEYERRQVTNLEAKRRIAESVAKDVPDGASLFINIGTTTEQAARALLGRRELRVITNNLNVARTLSENPSVSLIMVGGKVRNRDGAVTGQQAVAILEQFRVDIGIIGVSGIEHDGGLFDFDIDEVVCTRAIIRNSRRVFLLADRSKIGRPALVKIGSIREVSAFYTDAPPPAPLAAVLAESGTKIEVVGSRAP